jgi:hypothetical protein
VAPLWRWGDSIGRTSVDGTYPLTCGFVRDSLPTQVSSSSAPISKWSGTGVQPVALSLLGPSDKPWGTWWSLVTGLRSIS